MRELDINVINANSPEAKGRVERLFKTLQDRLVKLMRLAGITDEEGANRFMADTYLPDHNARFAVPARHAGDAHRPLTDELRAQLPAILSVQSDRILAGDFTIRFKNQWYQLHKEQSVALYPRDTITLEERLDGTVHARFKDTYLSFTPISKLERSMRPKTTAPATIRTRPKPAPDHPWRRPAARAADRAKKSGHAQ